MDETERREELVNTQVRMREKQKCPSKNNVYSLSFKGRVYMYLGNYSKNNDHKNLLGIGSTAAVDNVFHKRFPCKDCFEKFLHERFLRLFTMYSNYALFFLCGYCRSILFFGNIFKMLPPLWVM